MSLTYEPASVTTTPVQVDILNAVFTTIDKVAELIGNVWKVLIEEGRYRATWKREFKAPMAPGRSTNIISMSKWIRTSRLSIKNSLSGRSVTLPCSAAHSRFVSTLLDSSRFFSTVLDSTARSPRPAAPGTMAISEELIWWWRHQEISSANTYNL